MTQSTRTNRARSAWTVTLLVTVLVATPVWAAGAGDAGFEDQETGVWRELWSAVKALVYAPATLWPAWEPEAGPRARVDRDLRAVAVSKLGPAADPAG